MKPTSFGADLSAFAGQTVRIRAAVSSRPDPERIETGVTKGILNAGIDAVSIKSTGPGVKSGGGTNGGKRGPGAGGKIAFAKARFNRANGTVVLPVKVPAAGLLTATGTKKHPELVTRVKRRLAGATTAKLLLKPSAAAFRVLATRHRLRASMTISFNPNAGSSETAKVPVVFKLAPPRRRASTD